MARIVVGSYMVRYPLGGMLSWALQYLLGFHKLGHDVYFVEKANYPNACFDPVAKAMTDDGSRGMCVVNELLGRFGLGEKWCFVDYAGTYHGMSKQQIEDVLSRTDLYVDGGVHGAWNEEAASAGLRILIDGEPGFTQMTWEKGLTVGQSVPAYDAYFTNGFNIGTEASSAPTAGCHWRPVVNPVDTDLYVPSVAPSGAPYTTVMNWQSHDPLEYHGVTYGQKDVEFAKFERLPRSTPAALEIAVSGKNVPRERLLEYGWRLRDAHEVTASFEAFGEYIRASRGEFGVCKNVFVATNNGWTSDRSAAYLACGRPVVMQETGFSAHLPVGRGLFAVRTADEAAAAIEEIERDYGRHSRAAREIAVEHLDARNVLGRLLNQLGL